MTLGKISKVVNVDSPEMRVGAAEPDAACSFQSKGRILLEREVRDTTFVMTAGRAYFVVAANLRHGPIISQQVSFLLEDGQEYSIQFQQLPSDDYSKVKYAFYYDRFDGPDRKAVPVDVDHWSICKREKLITKDRLKNIQE